MSDFQSQLDGELERRGLKPKTSETDEAKNKPKKKKTKKEKPKKEKKKKEAKAKKPLPFSFKSFFIALTLGVLIFAGMVVWLTMNANKTAEKFVENLPTKTAIVNREVDPIITTEDVQPVLRMTPMEPEEQEKPPVPEDTKVTQAVAVSTAPESNTNAIAPIDGLYQSSDYGLLPITNKETGMTPFKAYKKDVSVDGAKPSIAFIVVNMGINNDLTKNLIESLPEEITLSFSPYAWNVKALMMAAQQDKHETWMTIPLETKDYPKTDPGPLAILNGASIKQNQIRLNTLMGKAVGYAGFISEKDHAFRSENARTSPIFKDVFNRGLAIIDSNDKSINFVKRIAEKNGYPHGQNNFWLDDDLRPLALNQKLRQALEQSRNNGKTIVMLRPYPASIKTLQKFLSSVAAQEFNIIPASALVTSE